MAFCGYFALLLIACFLALVSGLVGSLADMFTRPAIGAAIAAAVNAAFCGLFCLALNQLTPPTPSPEMSAGIARSLVILGAAMALGGGLASAALGYSIARRNTRH